jgi:hypothetical protein
MSVEHATEIIIFGSLNGVLDDLNFFVLTLIFVGEYMSGAVNSKIELTYVSATDHIFNLLELARSCN